MLHQVYIGTPHARGREGKGGGGGFGMAACGLSKGKKDCKDDAEGNASFDFWLDQPIGESGNRESGIGESGAHDIRHISLMTLSSAQRILILCMSLEYWMCVILTHLSTAMHFELRSRGLEPRLLTTTKA